MRQLNVLLGVGTQFGAFSTGNNVFDVLGRANGWLSLGLAANLTSDSVSTANSSTFADFGADTHFSITIGSASQRILYMIGVAAKTTGAGGQVSFIRGNIVGLNTSAGLIFDKNNTGWCNAFGWYFTGPGGNQPSIPPGTYPVRLEGATDNGQTVQLTAFFHQIWQIGP